VRNKLRDEKGNIKRNTTKIQKIIREYFENFFLFYILKTYIPKH
jgi:hypothetical protein